MRTYVTSLSTHARYSHIGTEHRTACGHVFTSGYVVTDEPSLPVCGRCLDRTPDVRPTTLGRASHDAVRDAALVALLIDGHDNLAVAQRLRIGVRTAVRYLTDAQRRAGARTRFQFGYRVGSDTVRETPPTEGDGWEQPTLF